MSHCHVVVVEKACFRYQVPFGYCSQNSFTGVGHVLWYTVEGKGQSLQELRTLQDWFIRYQLNAVPGVAEVATIGGTVRQYQILHPELVTEAMNRLAQAYLCLSDPVARRKYEAARAGQPVATRHQIRDTRSS